MSQHTLPDGLTHEGEVVSILFIFAAAFALSFVLTPAVRNAARRRGFVDQPDGRRKTHLVPVPRLGGLSVYLSFALSFGLFLAFLGPHTPALTVAYFDIVAACTAVMLVGLADDIWGVSPLAKIAVQTASGLYLYAHGYQIRLISNPFGDAMALGSLSLPLTLLWFVGVSNAFNLIDGLDGLAAGIGLFATSTVFVAALVNERWEIALFSIALAGGLFGFLRYNYNPASIFLGDSGALLVGFALAAFAVRGSMKSSTAIAVAAPLLGLALPILDTTLAMIRRILTGRSIFDGDAEHIHHRMVRRGLTPLRAVVVLYGVAALFGALSLLTTLTGQSQVIGLVVIVFSGVTWFGVHQLGYAVLGTERTSGPGGFPDPSVGADGPYLAAVKERFDGAQGLDEVLEVLREAGQRLGCGAVEVQLAAGVAAPEARSLPVLEAAPSAPLKDARSWTIPLVREGRRLGELTVERSVDSPFAHVEVSYFLDTVTDAFAAALHRLERARADDVQGAAAAGGS